MRILALIIGTLFIHFSLSAQIASGKGKWLGNIINTSIPGTYNAYWNQVTPENAGKWGSVENNRDVMQWSNLDQVYGYAKTNQLPFKFHTLVWGQQEPAFMKTLSPQDQLKEVESWILQVGVRYPDADYIDVVNEPLHAPPSYAAALGGDGSTGWDWVIWAFEKARKYCPKAKLLLNDYNILNNDQSTDKFIKIIELLKARKLIDGIGEQGHFFETTPIQTIQDNLGRLASTGLPIYISEFDINIANDQEQVNRYKQLFPIFWEYPAIKGITLWGYNEGQIWRTNAFLVKSNGLERPAMEWLRGYVALSTDIQNISIPDYNIKILGNPILNHNLVVFHSKEVNSMDLMDGIGKMIWSKKIKNESNTSTSIDLPSGMYWLKFTGNKGAVVKKIMVF